MTIVIKAENVSKKYIINHKKQRRDLSLADGLLHIGRQFKNRIFHPLLVNAETVEQEEFWALKDINFEIKQGDRVGIIGRNGAGKSTLLKILSRITEPTTGNISIRGRVASLLEVGTGFHPELTGRENVFLNGAILGLTKRDVQARFNDIVAFAEIEKFLDTPVKRYSSGMYVRLAFAVAAHLEPEILIVDEVLAVGDAQFQRKCLGKMKAVGAEGRTVLFVSHNIGLFQDLCSAGIILSDGKLCQMGGVLNILQEYKELIHPEKQKYYCGNGIIQYVECIDSGKGVFTGGDVQFNIHYECFNEELDYAIVGINDSFGQRLFTSKNCFDKQSRGKKFPEKGVVSCFIESFPLRDGTYLIDVAIGRQKTGFVDKVDHCLKIDVVFKDYFSTGETLKEREGYCAVKASWFFSNKG